MTTFLEEEIEEKTHVQGDKKKSIMDKMKERELLRYGSIINESDVEYCMSERKNDLPFDKWELIKLQFRELVKNQGFFITSRGRDDKLYILLPHEMSSYNESKK